MSSDTRPLAGVRVLSFGAFVAGNASALTLAEFGADVIKIESHQRPEFLRNAAYSYGDSLRIEPSGISNTPMNATLSRGARGVALDMDNPAGRDLFTRLVGAVDVVSENFGSGVMQSWGASYDELRAIRPGLVMLSQSGYGRTGRRASYRAYASNISNFTGLASQWATHGMLSDYVTGVHSAVAVIAALTRRRQTGQGTYLDIAQIEVMGAFLAPMYMEALVNDRAPVAHGNAVPGALLAGVYPCVDVDSWVAVELEDLDDWRLLCDVVERRDLVVRDAGDAPAHREALEAELSAWAAVRSSLTAAHLLQRAGLASAPVQTNEQVVHDPQLRHRHFPTELPQPDFGVSEYAGSPNRLSKTPGRVERGGPRVGEHTDIVLREWLGLELDELGQLEQAGAIFCSGRPR